MEQYIVNNKIKKRWKFLCHLSMGSKFSFIEIKLSDIISKKLFDK